MPATAPTSDAAHRLRPYAAGLALDWLQRTPDERHRRIEGSLAFVDISGFTTLTERLATKGKVGAEEMSDLLDASFASLLEEAYAYGASLVKWGGDAVLLLFEGPEHALLACRAAHAMRGAMRRTGRLRTSVGIVQLRMSVGVHSGSFDFFMGGSRHHEMVVAGPAASTTAVMEQTADAGEIVISPQTAASLPTRCLGAVKGDGVLLRSAPQVDPRSRWWGALRDPEVIGSCLDPDIRDHLLTDVGDSEHRQVAVGFLEVSGLDDLLVDRGATAVGDALHDLLVLVQEQCAHHRVTFWETDISRDGFKVMLVAGAPRSTGHDEDGLLRMARAVLDGHDGPARLRFGVNAGRVFSGGFGPPFRRTWSVKGDAVNLAARVMGKAASGELLATQVLLDRVSSLVEQEPLPPFLVKGKAKPIQASRVRAASARSTAGPAAHTGFVGRDAELELVRQRAAAALTGTGAALLVTGDPGIGKSWLVERACEELVAHRVVRVSADPYEASTPYVVLRQLLREVLGTPPETSNVEVQADIFFRVEGTPLVPLLPLLGPVLGLNVPDAAETASVQGRFRQARTARLAVDLMAHLAPGPMVLVVDDVHGADSASAEALAALAQAVPGQPWLLLLCGRSAPAVLAADPAVVPLVVAPLAEAESRALVFAGGGQSLAPHVVRGLVTRAEGNPLFLGELVAAAARGDGEELPATLEELLAAQIDGLLPQQRQVLRVASVLGVRFEEELLADLLDEPIPPATWSTLTHFVVGEGEGLRRFRTSLVRDAAYEGLPFRRRVELHGRAATALQSRADDLDDLAEALSLHDLAAQRFADAWRHSLVAGRRAQRVHANPEALVFYRRARTAARRLPQLDRGELAVVLEATGDVHARLAELEPAMLAYREARRLAPAQDHVLRARVALSAGLVAGRAGELSRATRWLQLAHHDTAAGTDAALLELDARIAVEQAFLKHTVGREADAAALCRRAVEQAEPIGAIDVVGRALLLLDMLDLRAGKPGDEPRVLRALALFEQAGDLPRQAGAWNHLGMTSYFGGDWDAAVERYGRAQAAHQRSGDDWSAAIASGNLGELLVDQGRLDEAEPLVTDALRVWRVSGTPSDIGFGAALLGRLEARRQRLPEALALFAEAEMAYGAKDELVELVDLDLRRAEAVLMHGATDQAGAWLEQAETRLRNTSRLAGRDPGLPPTPLTVALLRLKGVTALQLGDRATMSELLARSVDLARTLGTKHELALSLRAQAWGAAGARSAEAAELFDRLGVSWVPELPEHARPLPVPLVQPREGEAAQAR